MLRSILVLSLAFVAAHSSPIFRGWNQLVNGKGIFDEATHVLNYDSAGEAMILQVFTDLLMQDSVIENVYGNYRKMFSKTNDGSLLRKILFRNKLIDIAKHNLEAAQGKHTWTKGVNQFTDMTAVELKAQTTDFSDLIKELKCRNETKPITSDEIDLKNVPSSINWVTKGVVTPIKNQFNCGSCVMFSSTATLESALSIKTGQAPVSLSAQQLVDCAEPGFTCQSSGSLTFDSIEYLKNHGVTTWDNYPYYPTIPQPQNGPCQGNKFVAAKIGTFTSGTDVTSDTLKTWVAQGPVIAGLYCPPWDYATGVIPGSVCGNNPTDHAISIVGYDSAGGQDYWLIKNSYGTTYGENGYFRLQRGSGTTRACDVGSWAYKITAA